MPKLRCKCPSCQRLLQFEAKAAQTLRVTCPQCQRAFTIPAAGTAQTSAAAQGAIGDEAHQENALDDLFAHLPPTQSSQGQPTGAMHYGAGHVSSYAPPRRRKTLSPKAKRQIIAAVSIAGGALFLLVTGLFIAVPLIQRAGVGQLMKTPAGGVSSLLNFDSREAVLRDLESECQRLEAIGRAIPEGDQSEEAAKPLLEGRAALAALLRRACRLSSVRAQLADALPGADGGLPQRNVQAPADPEKWFWHLDMRDTSGKHVTEAINQLTSLRGSVYSVVTFGVLELPSPLEVKDEQFQWTDEDRRVLAARHLQGRFRRDFARALAAIDSDAVSAETLQPLHDVIDQYSKAARQLVETSRQMLEKAELPSHRILVQEPKQTPYYQQSQAMYAALLSLARAFEQWKDDPHFEFVMDEADKLGEDIGDIMFGSDPRACFVSEQTSLERYQTLAAKRQAEADRQAELAAKKAREEEEKQRLAEQRRREEETKRQQAEAERAAAASSPLASAPPSEDRPRPFPGDFGGPPGRRGPRRFGPRGMAVGGEASPHAPSFPSNSPPAAASTPVEPQATVTIKIRSDMRFDSNRIVRDLVAKTGVKRYSSSQSNNEATLSLTADGDLQRFVDAIDFGTVESVDEQSRTISVKIP